MPKKDPPKPPDMPTAPFFMGTYGDLWGTMGTNVSALLVIWDS